MASLIYERENCVANAVIMVLTLAFVFVSRGFSEKSDYLTWKWHPNQIYTRFLCLSYGNIKLLVL